jgi:small subunit ribosomal protein S23
VRAKRVFQTVAKSFGGPIPDKGLPPPAWFKALESIPPSQVLTRPIAIRHTGPPLKTGNLFKPTRIAYPEDQLRKEFYKDHPWELARPRLILELDGKDARYLDWSKGVMQPGVALSGERWVDFLVLGCHGSKC